MAVMSLATPAWVLQQVASRAFYAREDTWRPMILGTGIALAVIPLYLVLRESRGVEGLAVAGVIAMSVNASATLVWARVRHGVPGFRLLADACWRSVAIALPAALAASWVQQGGSGRLGAVVDLALGGAVFAVIAGANLFVFGDPALREVVASLLARRPGRKK
jgi:putative peptidoglycan lipid II flippase